MTQSLQSESRNSGSVSDRNEPVWGVWNVRSLSGHCDQVTSVPQLPSLSDFSVNNDYENERMSLRFSFLRKGNHF